MRLLKVDKFCKICFKKIDDYSLYNFVKKNNLLCEDCFSKLDAKFMTFRIGNVKGLAIYEYTDFIKELIYKFKGCYDYELKDIFLFRYLTFLKMKYYGYYIVFVPSYYIDDQRRGFNHVKAIFESLKLKELDILKKNKRHKQSEQTFKTRKAINKVIEIDENCSLKDKKLLLVDDIITTGSTLQCAIDLLKQKGGKKIEVLVIAKTKNKVKTEY